MNQLINLQGLVKNILSHTTNNPSIRQLLNIAIADEMMSVYQYLIASKYAKNVALAKELREHSMEEYHHAEILMDLLDSINEPLMVCSKTMQEFAHCGFIKQIKNDSMLVSDNIKSEECALKFYQSLQVMLPDEMKSKIQEIIDDEAEHIKDLKKFEENNTY